MQGLNKAVIKVMQPDGIPEMVRWAQIDWKITKIVPGVEMIHIATTNTENGSESWVGIPNEQIPAEVNTLQILPERVEESNEVMESGEVKEHGEDKQYGYRCKSCGNVDQTKFNLFFEPYCDSCGSHNIARVEQ